MSSDKLIIEQLGGPAKVCELLGLEKRGGVQRVQNWIVRGIPAKVRLDNPGIFPIAPPNISSKPAGAPHD